MARLHLLRSSYDLFVYDFVYDFFGIVGGYKSRRMCLHCLRSPYRLGPRLKKKIKNGYPENSEVCYGIILKKYIWCIRNHCIANFSELHNDTRANKVW